MPSRGGRRGTPRTAIPTSRTGDARPRALGSKDPSNPNDPDNDGYRGPTGWNLTHSPSKGAAETSGIPDLTSRSEVIAGIEEIRDLLVDLRSRAKDAGPTSETTEIINGLLDASRQLEYFANRRLEGIDDGLVEFERLKRTAEDELDELRDEKLAQEESNEQARAALTALERERAEVLRNIDEVRIEHERIRQENRLAKVQREEEASRHRKLLQKREAEGRAQMEARRAEAADQVELLGQEIGRLGLDGISRFSGRTAVKRRMLTLADKAREVAASLRRP